MTPIKNQCMDDRCKLGTWEGVVSSVMAIILIVVGFSWWCSSLDGRVTINTSAIDKNSEQARKQIEKVNNDIEMMRQSIQVLAISQAKMDTQYVQIREALTDIKNTLDKWEPANNGKDGQAEKR